MVGTPYNRHYILMQTKKDGFSAKNHPCAVTIMNTGCNPAMCSLFESILRIVVERMYMADGNSSSIGGIVRPRDHRKVKQNAYHLTHLLLLCRAIASHS